MTEPKTKREAQCLVGACESAAEQAERWAECAESNGSVRLAREYTDEAKAWTARSTALRALLPTLPD